MSGAVKDRAQRCRGNGGSTYASPIEKIRLLLNGRGGSRDRWRGDDASAFVVGVGINPLNRLQIRGVGRVEAI